MAEKKSESKSESKSETKAPQKTEQRKEQNVRYLIRIFNTDIDGSKPLYHGLTNIKGIGKMFAKAICIVAGIDWHKETGKLNEAELKKLNEVIKDPKSSGIPTWMLNRRKDPNEGTDKHVLTSDLDFAQSNDIKFMQKIRCYKGWRHAHGQPVRGQRTRSNFRRNKGKAAAVMKSKIAAPAPTSDKDKK